MASYLISNEMARREASRLLGAEVRPGPADRLMDIEEFSDRFLTPAIAHIRSELDGPAA